MPHFRIYAFNEGGEFVSYSDFSYDNINKYAGFIAGFSPLRNLISYEVDTPSYPKDDRDRWLRSRAAVNAGNLLSGYTEKEAIELIDKWARKKGILAAIDVEDEKPAEEPQKKKEKEMLQLAQDFVKDMDPEELAKRAHEATQAICRGTK